MKSRVTSVFKITSAVLVVVVFVLSLVLYTNSNKLDNLKKEGELLINNIDEVKKTLDFEKQQNSAMMFKFNNITADYNELLNRSFLLESELSFCKEDYSVLDSSSEQLQKEIDETLDKLNDFEQNINESLDWFNNNSNIHNLSAYSEIKKYLMKKCVDFRDNYCQIELTCIDDVNDDDAYLNYKQDRAVSDQTDYLQGLDMILENKGGDCDDFALLYKAEYNYLVDVCLENGYSRDQIVPYSSEAKKISKNYMYVVCGTFDPEIRYASFYGHCVVALVDEEIRTSRDIYRVIKESLLVEPQTGRVIDELGETEAITIFDDGDLPDTRCKIHIVITDEDIYNFFEYSDDIEWNSYADFKEDIAEFRNKITLY
jgi:hypothetical protein